jgi:hypothetical protein
MKFEDKQLLLREMPVYRLPLDCLRTIIKAHDQEDRRIALKIYRAMLVLSRFSRHSLHHNRSWRIWFTVHSVENTVFGMFHEWKLNGLLHREENDEMGQQLPAVITGYGMNWYILGKRNRDGNKPSIVTNHVVAWYKNSLKHREERDTDGLLLPARIEHDTCDMYYLLDIKVDRTGKPVPE